MVARTSVCSCVKSATEFKTSKYLKDRQILMSVTSRQWSFRTKTNILLESYMTLMILLRRAVDVGCAIVQ